MTDHKLPALLRDLLTRVMPFSNVISHIHMKEADNGHIMARAVADDASILLETETNEPIDLDQARMCLGNLPHLYQIVNSPMVQKDSSLDLQTKDRNGKLLVSALSFKPNNRMEFVYVPTDPFRASLASPASIRIDDWPVTFFMDKDAVNEFVEFRKIHGTIASGDDAVISVIYSDGGIMLEFGDIGTHNASIVLDVELDATSNQGCTVKVLAEHLHKALQQAKPDDGIIPIRLCPKALQVVSESPVAMHMMTVMGRKVRDD